MFRPMRKPAMNTVAAASTQIGQTGTDAGRASTARRDPDHAPEQVDERRVRERDAGEDVTAVEEPERRR